MDIYLCVLEILPANLRFLRKSRKLSQEDISAILSISRKKYSNYETGRTPPDLYRLCELANFYSIDIDRILKVRLDKQDK